MLRITTFYFLYFVRITVLITSLFFSESFRPKFQNYVVKHRCSNYYWFFSVSSLTHFWHSKFLWHLYFVVPSEWVYLKRDPSSWITRDFQLCIGFLYCIYQNFLVCPVYFSCWYQLPKILATIAVNQGFHTVHISAHFSKTFKKISSEECSGPT